MDLLLVSSVKVSYDLFHKLVAFCLITQKAAPENGW